MALLTRLWQWLESWFRPTARPLAVVHIEELPDDLAARTIYVAGESGHLWFAAMICPCGCGETLYMNLQPDSRPRWTLTEHGDKTISLSPSVWRRIGCRSHFYLRRGLVMWCERGEVS